MEESVKEVLEGMEPFPWHIAFQSKGGGPEEWIGPEVETVLDELASQKVREVLRGPNRICIRPYRDPVRH